MANKGLTHLAGILKTAVRGGRRSPRVLASPPLKRDLSPAGSVRGASFSSTRRSFLAAAIFTATAPLQKIFTALTPAGRAAESEFAFVTPEAGGQLQQLQGFVPIEQYAGQALETGEVGRIQGVRFILSEYDEGAFRRWSQRVDEAIQ